LTDADTINRILAWQPDIVLTSGPPLYLSVLSERQRWIARQNALKLAQKVRVLIIDHHLLRSAEGMEWLKGVQPGPGNRVLCAADFMQREPLLLEAWRRELYRWLPVPENWHEDYVRGNGDLQSYWQKGWGALIKRGKVKSICF